MKIPPRFRPTSADVRERRALAISALLLPVYRQAIRTGARGEDATDAWNTFERMLQRGLTMMAVYGVADIARRVPHSMRRADVVMFAAPQLPTWIKSFVTGLTDMPFLEATRALDRLIPRFVSVLEDLVKRTTPLASRIRQQEQYEAIQSIIAAVRERTTGASENPVDLVEAAISLGMPTSRVTTFVRTTTMSAYSAGTVEQARRMPDVIPAFSISEIKDTRTRGNPNGLYPAPGMHWQMDKFLATAADSIWGRVIPPNGYNCRATLMMVTWGQLREMGLLLPDGSMNEEEIRRRYARQRAIVDAGLYPDPGFKDRMPLAA